MGHTPFGYRIENGVAVIDEEKKVQLLKLYEGYLGGLGLQQAADEAGIKVNHCQAKRMMLNKKYLGTEHYPQLVPDELQERVQMELKSRAEKLGRVFAPKEAEEKEVIKKFTLERVEKRFDDPYRQAEYAFSLIREVALDG